MRRMWHRVSGLLGLLCACLMLSPALGSPASPSSTGFQNKGVHPSLSEMLGRVNETHLRSYVQIIQEFGPHPTNSQALQALEEYLYNQLSSLNISVDFDAWETKKYTGNNIVATLPGTLVQTTCVILCAHCDSLAISPGAEDDGSGVAAVLEVASIMHDYSFNTTVKVILFSGEEQGLLGSRSYAQNAVNNHEAVLGVLALDKIGYAVTEEEGHTIQHHANPGSAWMTRISGNVASLFPDEIGLTVLDLPEDPQSDHYAFVENGFAGTDFVRNATNPYYHTSEDIIDHMNLSYLTDACKLTLGTIVTMASLNPRLGNDDLKVSMEGTRLSRPAQFSVVVENTNNEVDTANVTISIAMKQLVRGGFIQTVKQGASTPCNWSIEKEVRQQWEFEVGGRRFTRGLFMLEVTIFGSNDDLYLYKTERSYGIILRPSRVFMIPRQS